MKRIVFYLTIILSFPLLLAGEDNNDKSKEEAEYYRILNLAKAYEHGTELKKDERKAFLYYLDAVRNSKYSESEALKYLEKKAKEGNPYAQFSYGSYYADFEFWPYDSQKAFYWFSKAAEKNHPAALNNLALMYIFGNGVKKDVKKGRELMLKAAELGVEYSQYSVAKVYARLDDIIAHNANYKEAFKCFEILKGCLASKYDIGECIFHGRGLPEDKSKAVEIWKSMLGDVVDIIDPNYKDVFKWIEVLARKGSLPAKYDMGVCYFYGRGVPEDKSKAVKIWESMSSEVMEKENNILKFDVYKSLYYCYNNGLGVAKDEEKSNELLSLIFENPSSYRKKLKWDKDNNPIRFTFEGRFIKVPSKFRVIEIPF